MHDVGRTERVDREAPKRMVKSINRILGEGDAVITGATSVPEITKAGLFAPAASARPFQAAIPTRR